MIGLPLSLCGAGRSSFDTSVKTQASSNNESFKGLFFNLLSLKVVRPSVDMIVCRTCCECKKMKCCPEEQNLGFVESSTILPISQCTLMKMVTQLITKRLSNFKTYYFVIPPSRVLHQNKNLVKMIFCKRRIGVLNFSGYYNRKRTRRWHVDVH